MNYYSVSKREELVRRDAKNIKVKDLVQGPRNDININDLNIPIDEKVYLLEIMKIIKIHKVDGIEGELEDQKILNEGVNSSEAKNVKGVVFANCLRIENGSEAIIDRNVNVDVIVNDIGIVAKMRNSINTELLIVTIYFVEQKVLNQEIDNPEKDFEVEPVNLKRANIICNKVFKIKDLC